ARTQNSGSDTKLGVRTRGLCPREGGSLREMHSDRIPLRPGRDDVTLTTYLLDATAALPASGSRPPVLVLPGGGYTHCAEREGEPIAMAFAALGYHAFVLRYSVYGEPDPADPFAARPDRSEERRV